LAEQVKIEKPPSLNNGLTGGNKKAAFAKAMAAKVESTGLEPVSKHICHKLSTCLFHYCLSATGRKRTNQPVT
jgi:hypothetical protein